MEKSVTSRGFGIVLFEDAYNAKCSIQQSSADYPAIWLGVNDAEPKIMASKVTPAGVGWVKYPIHPDVLLNTRMHLDQEQVRELLPILQKFAETGEI